MTDTAEWRELLDVLSRLEMSVDELHEGLESLVKSMEELVEEVEGLKDALEYPGLERE